MNSHAREKCIQLAQELMPSHRTGRSFHMSFILHRRKLLVWSTNDYRHQHLFHRYGNYLKTKSDTRNYITSRHSEMLAIKKFINKFGHSDFSGLTLFNVRIGFDGNPMLAAPCQNCDRLFIRPNNFKEVLWTI